ncbi:group II intron maturase-specific domain-containing protein [Streptomyces sp. SID14515]|uniref:group II intron maturase-specific domain-containing protein n=1 Tax=Streptomyces sp. SID14515 TaxID=2706074 RepID=UPI0013C89778|nr:hypothetical protein [Streptomyces sp. SID14515]
MVHIEDGFDFLGHHIRRQRKRDTNKLVVYTRPSKKAIKAVKDRVSERTYIHTQNQSLATLLEGLNRTMTGWATYFRHGAAKRTFNAVDHHAWHRVAIWRRRKHGIPSSQLKGFCDQGWRFTDSGTVFLGASSVMIERYRYRGARIPTPRTIVSAYSSEWPWQDFREAAVCLHKRIMAGRAGVPLLRHRVILMALLRRRFP